MYWHWHRNMQTCWKKHAPRRQLQAAAVSPALCMDKICLYTYTCKHIIYIIYHYVYCMYSQSLYHVYISLYMTFVITILLNIMQYRDHIVLTFLQSLWILWKELGKPANRKTKNTFPTAPLISCFVDGFRDAESTSRFVGWVWTRTGRASTAYI